MDRDELLDRVMHKYRRVYMKKSLFHHPWHKHKDRRTYTTARRATAERSLHGGFRRARPGGHPRGAGVSAGR